MTRFTLLRARTPSEYSCRLLFRVVDEHFQSLTVLSAIALLGLVTMQARAQTQALSLFNLPSTSVSR